MKTRKLCVVGAVGVALAVLPGCGSSTSPTPIPSATPTPVPPTVQTVVSSGNGSIGNRLLAFIPFTTSATGRLDVTVDWTFASNNVDVYLVRGACTFEQFIANQCNLLTFSESTVAKPERITLSGATAGNYFLLIGNRGPADESAAFQVVLTTGGGASAASAGPGSERPRGLRGYTGAM